MPVDPELQPLLALMSGGPPLGDIPLAQLRQGAGIDVETAAPLAAVVNRTITTAAAELPIRIYYPRAERPLPVLVYFHGGGFVLGSLDSHDSVLRRVALGADCIVVAVDYRLAPEHRFPAAVDDALAAVRWVEKHGSEIGGDRRRIAVGGDSAGGNLATVAALQLRDAGAAVLAGQLLIYPVTQLCAPVAGSMLANGQGYFLRAIDMQWFAEMYLRTPDDANHPYASPILATDLKGLPPAFVLTAEFDPLLDQGAAYAARLSTDGNDCVYRHYAGAFHGFLGMNARISHRAVAEACAWLKATFTHSH